MEVDRQRALSVLKDDKDLAIFVRNMAKFDRFFCEAMTSGIDFTLKFEVRGDGGRLLHCRVGNDGFERPIGESK